MTSEATGRDNILVPIHGAWMIAWDEPNFSGNYTVYNLPFTPPNPAPTSNFREWRFNDFYRRIYSLEMGPHATVAITCLSAIQEARFARNERWGSFPPSGQDPLHAIPRPDRIFLVDMWYA
jgi:hypothetical protein